MFSAAFELIHAAQTTNSLPLSQVRVSSNGRGFVTAEGKPFFPFGVNYFRPGTGWAPQVWKQFDAEATRADFVRMKELGMNCVRVFLSFGSFYMEPGKLSPEGLAKFDQFLAIAEEAGIYVHPTGPDHWEGLPEWAREDRIADEKVLSALEEFWKLFAARYRNRNVIFAYDLLNEPEVRWDSPSMRTKWNVWLEKKYVSPEKLAQAWAVSAGSIQLGSIAAPEGKDAPRDKKLLDYQAFREFVADEWTRRQTSAIRSVDPRALVTVGLIQWSVPSLLPRVQHYSGFRPERQARFLDFLEVHFYPLDRGAFEYRTEEDELRNLAYLESVVREVARPGKPVVVAEFGWYGGAEKPTFDQGRHPPATEEQQARWCRGVVETSAGWAVGWLNWGFYDHPESRDVTQLTGLLTHDGKLKAWGREFKKLSSRLDALASGGKPGARPDLDWDLCVTSLKAGNEFREKYFQAFRTDREQNKNTPPSR